ncbi:hypothetical protein K2X85_20030 [bacterium]|nr:hypothetical protein [bacterium]
MRSVKRKPAERVLVRRFNFERLEERRVLTLGPFDLALVPGSDDCCSFDPVPMENSSVANVSARGEISLSVAASGSPLSSLPLLTSNSSASAVLFLDFDGFTDSDGWRNGGFGASSIIYPNASVPPFDLDNDATTYSSVELDAIREIWQRVSEDYSPFNINVTTIEPANFDNGAALRIAIGGNGNRPDGTTWFTKSNPAVAWIGSFTNNADNTAWVFPYRLQLPTTADWVRRIAEDASHEAGHSFGLEHQSSWTFNTSTLSWTLTEYNPGSGAWGPIMGDARDRSFTTWNRGPTPAGVGSSQDDMAILANSTNGFGYRADEAPDSYLSAIPLTVGSPITVGAAGYITTNTDEDWYYVDVPTGPVRFTVTPASVGANLEANLRLFAGNGQLVTQGNATDNVPVTISASVNAGRYCVGVRSTAATDPSKYGRVGQYGLSGVISPGPDSFENNDSLATASVIGNVGSYYNGSLTSQYLDDDYFRFTAASTGIASVLVNFARDYGDLDLSLYNGAGNLLQTFSSSSDDERGSIPVTAGQTYYVRVFGVANAINTYRLFIDVSIGNDALEQNDTFGDATSVSTANSWGQYVGLNIDRAYDDDYFTFVAPNTGTASFSISFSNASGNIDLIAYNANFVGLTSSTTATDSESISFSVVAGQRYYARVYGVNGAINPNYSLRYWLPDRFEDNDTYVGAYDLGRVVNFYDENLTVSQSDPDYFAFTSKGTGSVTASIYFEHARGDLSLVVWQSPLGSIGISQTSGNVETVTFNAIPNQTYRIQVYGNSLGLRSQEYGLSIVTPFVSEDRFEQNDTFDTATSFGYRTSLFENTLNMDQAFDSDYYSFIAPGTGIASATIDFLNSQGDLDIWIYDQNRQYITGQFGITDGHLVNWSAVADQKYFIKVDGLNNPNYSLRIFAAANRPPVPNAGGPYTILEGTSLVLNGATSTDPDGQSLEYSWDVNGDGVFGDVFGVNPSLSWVELNALGILDSSPNPRSMAILVTDFAGAGRIASTTLRVNNAAPTANLVSYSPVRGEMALYYARAVDPSPTDQSSFFRYDIDWNNDGIFEETTNGPTGTGPIGGTLLYHSFATSGSYPVRIRATDKDGGVSSINTILIQVQDWTIRPDPSDQSLFAVAWGGTSGSDAVSFARLEGNGVQVSVATLNGASVNQTFNVNNVTGRLFVFAGGGNDTVIGSVGNDSIDGGDGNDLLYGETIFPANGAAYGRDTIVGGSGDDTIYGDGDGGEGAADELRGGDGNDTIYGDGSKGASDGFDTIWGGNGNDTIYGDMDGAEGAADRLYGEDGDDFINGGGGNDRLEGGVGNDILLGGDGGEGAADSIAGGDGRDILVGDGGPSILNNRASGVDTLEGGSGQDIIVSGLVFPTELNPINFALVRAEWTSNRSLGERMANLSGQGNPSSANGDNFLRPGANLFDDRLATDTTELVDQVYGGPDEDWMFLTIAEVNALDYSSTDSLLNLAPFPRPA